MTIRAPGITGISSLLQEAFVVAQRELAVDLAHDLEGYTHSDQQTGAGESERPDPRTPGEEVRDRRHDGDEHAAGECDAVDDAGEIALRLRTRPDARDEPALATDLVGLAHRVE